MNNAILKVKSIKLKETEALGKRFKECREWMGLRQNEVGTSQQQVARFESGEKDALLSSILAYAKSLGLKSLSIDTGIGIGKLKIDVFNYKDRLKSLRLNKAIKTRDHDKLISHATISRIDNDSRGDTRLSTIIRYVKALGVKTLIINID